MKPMIPDARLDRLKANLETLQGGRTDEEMAWKIRVKSPKTWRVRKRHPETMMLRELLALCQVYKKEPSDLLEKDLI